MSKGTWVWRSAVRLGRPLCLAGLTPVLLGSLLWASPASAQPTVYAYVTDDGNLSVINTSTNAVVATVHVASNDAQTTGVAITPDGAYAYVTDYGGYAKDNLRVIDIATDTVVAKVHVGVNPIA